MKRENKRIKRTTGYSPVRSSSVNTANPHSPPAIPRQRVQHKTPCSSAESLSEKPEIVGFSLFYGYSVSDFPSSSSSTMSGSSSGNASSSESESNFLGIKSCSDLDLSIPDLSESQGHEGHRKAMQDFLASTDLINLGPRNGQGNSSVASVDEDEDDLLHEFSNLGYTDYSKVCEAYDAERKKEMQEFKRQGPCEH